ncbi:alpha/beta hydrolase [Clostridium sp.]|uniref:alpha/beta hydrolase n=1 Tax=Clostridium sp. TaxID=1506 RepID=UPI00284D6237|nr:alpha/beta hydrolase [Clostridium sp.]MDR3593408.1 lysophospholipase [Clostridium sp.]
MTEREFFYKSDDKINLFFREIIPEGQVKAVICLVHGLGDHSGWFNNLFDFFVSNNFAILTFDLRGHGKSDGKRGHILSYEALMKDIDLLLNIAKKNFDGVHLFLYGHSFGGNQVLNYALRYHPDINGIIVSAPWLSLYSNPSKIKLYFTFLMSKIKPSFIVDNVVEGANLSHNPDIAINQEKDPLVHNFVSASLFTNAYKAGEWAIDNASNLGIPLLLFHGDSDKITSHIASEAFIKKAPSNLTTFKLWKGLYHSLHNEISNRDIFINILNWVNAIKI